MSSSNVKRNRQPEKKICDDSSSSDEDYSDDEDEGCEGYKRGGYHPVQIGEMYKNRYEIKSKLGWGHFSTVWAALDHESMKYVALKVQKSAEHYTEAAMDEIKLLSEVSKKDTSETGVSVVKLLDHFFHEGPNGTHMCFVFEVLGQNLLSVIKDRNYEGCPLLTVREIARQVAEGLAFLHDECGIIHTDLKPENILVVRPKQNVLDHLEDFPLATSITTTSSTKTTAESTTFVPNKQSLARRIENEDIVSKLKREIEELVVEMSEMKLSKSQRKRKRQKLKKKRQQLEQEMCVVRTNDVSVSPPKPPSTTTIKEDKRYSFAVLQIGPSRDDGTPTIRVLCNDRNQAMLWVQHALAVEYVITNRLYRYEHGGEILVTRIDSKIRNRWLRTRGLWFVDFGDIATTSTRNKKRKRNEVHHRRRSSMKSSSKFGKYFEDADPTILCAALETIRSFVDINISSTKTVRTMNTEAKLVPASEKEWSYPTKSFFGRFVFAAPSDLVNAAFKSISSSSVSAQEETKRISSQFHFRVVCKDRNHVIMMKVHTEKRDCIVANSINRFVGLALYQRDTKKKCVMNYDNIFLYTVRFDVRYMNDVIASLEKHIPGLRFFRVPHQCSLSLDSTVLRELTLPYSAREMSFGAMGAIVPDSCLQHVRSLNDRLGVWAYLWSNDDDDDGNILRNSLYFNDGRPIQVKIVDLGNSCWRDEHFSEDIQTRQYRCPEVILANGYDTPSDMWSFACVLFELYTGDVLFDPKADDSGSYSRDEDHIAQTQELLGVMPRHVSRKSKIGRSFFNRKGDMIRIKDLKFWKLKDVLVEKYRKDKNEAEVFADFLEKCMAFNPDHRATAKQCLDHPFLRSLVWSPSFDSDRSVTSKSPRKI